MAEKAKIPAIRFKGFTDAWEQHELGEIYTERNERGYDSLQILSVSIHHGVSNKELDSNALGKEVRRSEDKSLYKHVYFGDLVFNMMRAWQGAIGVVKFEGMVSPAYITAIPSAQLFPLFMDYCLRRDRTIIQMNNLSYGVTDFRKRLYWDSFINILCLIPSSHEQERITAFLTQLDKLITLQQRKFEKLQNVKKAMLDKMFPNNGSNVPEMRFAGFTDAWEQRKLNELGNIVTGSTPSTQIEGYYSDNGIPWVTPTDISENITFSTERKLSTAGQKVGRIVPKNTILVTCIASIGKNTMLGTTGSFNQQINGLIPNEKKNSPYFLFAESAQWSAKMKKSAAAGTMQIVNKADFSELTTKVPTLAEQQQIGVFFCNLDNLISLHQRKLEKLQNIKKACLEKMFV